MSEEAAIYIHAALSSLGINCRSLDISSYSPEIFGNLVATAQTDEGAIHIVYDRGIFVEADVLRGIAPTDQIVAALERHKNAAANGR